MDDFPLKERCGKTLDRRTISQLKARIEQLEAENRKLHDAIAASYMPSDIKALEKDDE